MNDYEPKIVLITGATAGFGAACARRFAKAGARIIATGRRTKRLEALANELETDVHCVTLDVCDREAVQKMADDLPADFRDVDVLINNAGLALGLEPAHAVDLDDWDTMIDTNIKGLTYVTRAILPGLVERNRGHVFNIGSVAGNYPYPGGNVYGGTKAFVKQFSLNLRADLAGTEVKVTNIEPGLAETEFSVVRFKGDEGKAGNVYKGTQPLTGEDIAETIYRVCTLPAHVNVNRLEIMPVCQSFSAFTISRKE
jgi:3-hydroxy acid dehydrogenase/malonic semialdehyde reductase